MARSTVQDVAKTAGVSVGTVPRVLNGSPAGRAVANE
ncbi:LacI family DNA-binding transcriptional regulator [Pseudarthrobacter sp. PvP004]|nr:LacI family DNA-binding transcriptional regulator [Pseudarthrobacter sp. PvP004]